MTYFRRRPTDRDMIIGLCKILSNVDDDALDTAILKAATYEEALRSNMCSQKTCFYTIGKVFHANDAELFREDLKIRFINSVKRYIKATAENRGPDGTPVAQD